MMTDEVLAERSRRGSGMAFAALVERHCDAIYRIAQNICTSAAAVEDVLRQTFLAAYYDAAARPREASFRIWLYGIALRKALNQRRSALHSLDCMEVDARVALVLCDLVDLAAEEAAVLLEVSAEIVRRRLHRARLMLRGLLDRRWSA